MCSIASVKLVHAIFGNCTHYITLTLTDCTSPNLTENAAIYCPQRVDILAKHQQQLFKQDARLLPSVREFSLLSAAYSPLARTSPPNPPASDTQSLGHGLMPITDRAGRLRVIGARLHR